MIDNSLGSLLDERQAAHRLGEAGLRLSTASPDYVRHKPGQSTVIGYRFVTADGMTTRGYAVWCPDPARISAIYHKARSLRPRGSALGPGVVRLGDDAMAYGFPNDARLRRLRWYTQPRKVKRSLHGVPSLHGPGEEISSRRTSVEVFRYKPERRVVAGIQLVSRSGVTLPVVVRYMTGRDAPALARTAAALRNHGVETPAPLVQLEGGRVGIDELAAGQQLRTLIDGGQACPSVTADALRRFHETEPPPGTAIRSIADDMDQARRALAGLADLHLSLAAPLAALAQRLSTTAPDEPESRRLIHGDLHPKNLLGDPSGRSSAVTFIDLERVAIGQPAADLGRLLGHAKALEVRDPGSYASATEFARTVIDRYRVEVPVPEPQLSWYTAIALIDQATLVARHLEGDWRWSSAHLAAAAFRELGTVSSRRAPA